MDLPDPEEEKVTLSITLRGQDAHYLVNIADRLDVKPGDLARGIVRDWIRIHTS